ncbi:MAG TPA: hypothetical protein VIK18_02400, partial [Pirellulales bacterium]
TANSHDEIKRLQKQQSGGQPTPPPQLDAFERQQGPVGQAAKDIDRNQSPARRADGDVAQRYQRRLEEQAQGRPAIQNGGHGGATYFGNAAPGAGPAPATSPLDRASRATGLASLDVKIPRRGVVYRFTTPRGEVHVTAQAVSARLTTSLFRLGIVALVALFAIAFCRWGRNGRLLRTLDSGLGCGAVILLALISLVCGLPMVLLALLAIGIFMSVRRWDAPTS